MLTVNVNVVVFTNTCPCMYQGVPVYAIMYQGTWVPLYTLGSFPVLLNLL